MNMFVPSLSRWGFMCRVFLDGVNFNDCMDFMCRACLDGIG
jgi:hypothetical protein